jgi:hypothetical protein
MPKPTSYHVKCRISSPHQAKSRYSGEMPWRPFSSLPRMENRRASRAGGAGAEQDDWHAFSGKTAPTQHTDSHRRPQAPHGTRRKRKKLALQSVSSMRMARYWPTFKSKSSHDFTACVSCLSQSMNAWALAIQIALLGCITSFLIGGYPAAHRPSTRST